MSLTTQNSNSLIPASPIPKPELVQRLCRSIDGTAIDAKRSEIGGDAGNTPSFDLRKRELPMYTVRTGSSEIRSLALTAQGGGQENQKDPAPDIAFLIPDFCVTSEAYISEQTFTAYW